MIVLIGGYWFLGQLVSFFGANRIEASYPGMELHGDVDDWGWGWEYNFLEVTQPAEADLSVQFGTGPAINIKDLTPALVTRYENETHVGADERPPDLQIFGAGGSTVFFRGGVVIRAQFRENAKICLVRGKRKFAMPVSKSQFDAIFGKPLYTGTRRFCL
ncbi:MAG: hypothetical protein ACLQLG_05900 [Thermoguttaceae bacterium]